MNRLTGADHSGPVTDSTIRHWMGLASRREPVESIETTAARFALRDDGILHVERLPGAVTTGDLVTEQIDAVRRLIGDTRRPVLFDPKGSPMTDFAAWRSWIAEAPDLFVAAAILHDEGRNGPLPSFPAVVGQLLFPVQVFTDEGITEMSGKLPVNPSGGCLSAHAVMVAGLARLIEAALQVRGKAGERQINGCRTALAHGINGPCGQSHCVMVVGQ